MKIDPNRIIPSLTDENLSKQEETSVTQDRDLLDPAPSFENNFARIIESATQEPLESALGDRVETTKASQEKEAAEVKAEAEKEVQDVGLKVLAGVTVATGIVVGVASGGVIPAAIMLAIAAVAGFSDVRDAVVSSLEYLGGAIEDAGKFIGRPLEDSAKWLAGAVESIGGSAESIASDVGHAIADGAGAVADAVSDAPGAVADAISDVCDW
jgi:hypothetical protein